MKFQNDWWVPLVHPSKAIIQIKKYIISRFDKRSREGGWYAEFNSLRTDRLTFLFGRFRIFTAKFLKILTNNRGWCLGTMIGQMTFHRNSITSCLFWITTLTSSRKMTILSFRTGVKLLPYLISWTPSYIFCIFPPFNGSYRWFYFVRNRIVIHDTFSRNKGKKLIKIQNLDM